MCLTAVLPCTKQVSYGVGGVAKSCRQQEQQYSGAAACPVVQTCTFGLGATTSATAAASACAACETHSDAYWELRINVSGEQICNAASHCRGRATCISEAAASDIDSIAENALFNCSGLTAGASGLADNNAEIQQTINMYAARLMYKSALHDSRAYCHYAAARFCAVLVCLWMLQYWQVLLQLPKGVNHRTGQGWWVGGRGGLAATQRGQPQDRSRFVGQGAGVVPRMSGGEVSQQIHCTACLG